MAVRSTCKETTTSEQQNDEPKTMMNTLNVTAQIRRVCQVRSTIFFRYTLFVYMCVCALLIDVFSAVFSLLDASIVENVLLENVL